MLGGFFAWFEAPRTIHYLAPDTERWEDLELGYPEWLAWCFTEGLPEFYGDHRWPGWEREVEGLPGDTGLEVTPPLFIASPPLEERSRRTVPVEALWDTRSARPRAHRERRAKPASEAAPRAAAERVPCARPGCEAMILPSTAEATEGFCRPCANRAKGGARARHVACHRVSVDRFAGVSDVVEILRRIHRPPPRSEQVRLVPYPRSAGDLYRGLGRAEAERLVALASGEPDLLAEVASHLACHAEHGLEACQLALLANGDAYPAAAFRAASTPVVERLLALVDSSAEAGSAVELDHALGALAWSRHPLAVARLRAWAARPPSWKELLHWAPHQYAQVAGYAIEGGALRDLVPPVALRLAPAAQGTPGAGAHVSLFEASAGAAPCPRCAKPATDLLRLEPGVLPAALRDAVPAQVPTCLACACFETLFVRFGPEGSWRWLEPVGEPEPDPGGWPVELRRAALVPRTPWEVSDWRAAEGPSQLGGHPCWVQQPHYPECPSCARLMETTAQVDLYDFFEFMEGTFYVHRCGACAVVGVSYQQT